MKNTTNLNGKKASNKISLNGVAFTKEDWDYFCSKINWRESFLDAKAIRIMNNPIRLTLDWEVLEND